MLQAGRAPAPVWWGRRGFVRVGEDGFWGQTPCFFELCVLFPPSREGRGSGRLKTRSRQEGVTTAVTRDQQDKGLPIDIPATSLVVEFMGFEDALGHFTAFLVRVIHHKRALCYPVFPKKHRDAQPQGGHSQGILAWRKTQDKASQRVCP